MAAILGFIEPKIAPFDTLTPKILYHRTKHEVDQMTRCGDFDLDLDLDSARIQLDTMGHTPTPSVSVKSCHLCFLPGEPHLS